MNFLRNWTNGAVWTVLILTLFFGVSIGSAGKGTETKEVVREVPKEVIKEVEVDKNRADWLELLNIDNQIIDISAKYMGETADLFRDFGNGDFSNLSTFTTNTQLKTTKMESLANQRHAIMRQLGVE